MVPDFRLIIENMCMAEGFEEADALDINVFCQQNAGRYKFRVGLKSTIKELKELLDAGAITQAEFDDKRAATLLR